MSGFGFDGLADLLVDTWDADENCWLDRLHGSGQLVEPGTVGNACAVAHERVVHVAGGDVRERQEGDAAIAVAEAERAGGNVGVAGEVAVG